MIYNLKKIKLLFMLLFAVFYSCEKDLYDEAFKPKSKKITVKHISFKDLNSNDKSKISSKINEVIKINKLNNSTSKFEYNAELDIYIDTNLGTLVNNNGKLYYTFPMYRESEENLENIIFTPDDSGEFETFIAKYNIKPEEFNELTLDEKETLIPQLQKVYYNSLQYICIDYIYTVTTYPNCDQPGIPHENGQICSSQIVTYTATFCNWTDMGGGDSGSGGGGSIGGSTGGGTGGAVDDGIGGGSGSGGVSTSPVGMSTKDLLIKEFKKHLFNTGNTTCFNSLTQENQEKILNFLNPILEEDCDGNLYTNEQQFDFIEEIIVAKCSNSSNTNIDETNYPGMNEGMPYNWWKDDEFIRNNLLVAFEVPNIFEILAFNMFPAYALLHIENSTTALDDAVSLTINNPTVFPPTVIENGKADAFRHAYWNALDSAEFGPNITKIFTTAHEAFSCGLPKTMDLYNNQKGRQNTADNGFGFTTSNSMIKSSILNDVYIGNLVYINNILLTPTNN